MVAFMTTKPLNTAIMCVIDWTSIGIKQFLISLINTQKRYIQPQCKVTFGLKYIYEMDEP